jgi:signal transduction histidine kinase/ligand-binding sensor domain-containing protein/AraC-like DNA-binding protein
MSYLNISNGLSNNFATSIVQDKFGFIWVGTFDGLNRYDGFECKKYRNKWLDTFSLINNHIVALSTNNKGIWIGTLKGVSFFDFGKQDFKSFNYIPSDKKTLKKLEARCSELHVWNNTVCLCTEDKGLLILEPGATTFQQASYNNSSDYNVQGACEIRGRLFLFIKNIGLCIYNRSSNNIQLLSNKISDGGKLLPINNKDQIYIGTQNGLYQFDVISNTIEPSPYNTLLSSKNITGLMLSKDQHLWITTDGGGITIIDLLNNNTHYISNGDEANKLKSSAVYAVFEDRDQRKWIATLRGGVSIIDNKNILFEAIRRDPFSKNSLVSNFTLSFTEDEEHNIWIGTDGGGLSKWNMQNNTFTNFVHNTNNNTSLGSNFIVSLLSDYKNRLWAATFGGGIQLLDKKTGEFINYPCYNQILGKYDINFWKLFQDNKHRIWAGATRGGAMYVYNEIANKWDLFDNSLTNIHAINQDLNGDIWAGSYKELIKIDANNKEHVRIPVEYPILCLHNDSQNRLWLGSEGGGLILFDKKMHTFQHFTETDGLPSNTILNILEDADGNLWCSSYNGLSRFNFDKKVIKNFNSDDGLQSNEFNYNAGLKLSNGQLLFGGINGFNIFNPSLISGKPNQFGQPLITSIRINKTLIQQTAYWLKETAVENIASINIPYRDANIDIDYVTLAFSNAEKVKYSYYLEGWDKDWNSTTSRSITYNNLQEGHYVLHIKSTNSSGEWSNVETKLIVTILPPWYRSWWAYLMYALALFTLGYAYLKYRTKQQKLNYEVQLAKITAKNEKELSERKASFFTSISHEFRTLLTLIINPINELMQKDTEEEKPIEIKVAYNNSRRMLSLVDQLLLYRKTEANEAELNIGAYNVYDLCKEVFDSFHYQAKVKDIKYILKCDNKESTIFVDAEKIEISLFNLISNAIKYTPKGGLVKIEIKDQADSILISISDSGSGFDKTVGNNIFKQYYQVKSLESGSKPGFGIGLYLVKNFTELHNGKVKYTTEPGKGTTFTIQLLKGTSHLPSKSVYIQPLPQNQIVKEIIVDDVELPSTTFSEKIDEIVSEKKILLIADDNEKLTEYIKSIFNHKFNVLIASNGTIAYDLTVKNIPDIVITDLNMPGGISGYELCVKLKNNEKLKHIPVVLLTGEDSSDIRLQCIESGAEDYIIKPFNKALLIAKVKNLVASKANLQQYFLNHVTLKEEKLNISDSDKLFLDQCINLVKEHLFDEQFAIGILSKEMGMSHSTLYKKIKNLSGYSVNGFVRMIRLRNAAELLINTNYNVNQVATESGFNDIKHFRTQFSKLFNCTPSEYIKKYRIQFQGNYRIKKGE